MNKGSLLHKIHRRLQHIRLQPIRVYCMHHVCADFDAESMNECDWMQIDKFKSKVIAMQQDGVEFISLTDAYNRITNDKWRNNKYVVLTFDDGYGSLKEILPWLEEQHIPATLFINGKYLDGKSYRKNHEEKYLTKEELFAITSSWIEIGSHGWEHSNALQMSKEEFEESIVRNVQVLSVHPCYIPFYAYTWGRHTNISDSILKDMKLIPVLMDGKPNYSETQFIHRELIE